MRAAPRLVSLALALALTGACGGDDAQAFCEQQEKLDSIEVTDREAIDEAIRDAAEHAPDEIRDEVDTVSDALAGIDDVDSPEQAEDALAGIREASERIERWVDENCEGV